MAERKAQNKYIPPDFDPKKHDSVNNYHTSRQMRPRPQNRKMGVPVIRFEMPYNVWCEGCEKHVAMGVRFNATKKRVGMYLSTIIWEFGMKCHLCAGWMVIRTDPKNSEYVCMSGVRKKNEEWEPGAETNQVQFNTEEERAKLAEDAFFKLEHDKEDKIKLSTVVPGIAFIQNLNDRYWRDPYALSKKMRLKFRTEKKEAKIVNDKCLAIQSRSGLECEVLPEIEEDRIAVKQVQFNNSALSNLNQRASDSVTNIFSRSNAYQNSTLRTTRQSLLDQELKRQKMESEMIGSLAAHDKKPIIRRHTENPTNAPILPLCVDYNSDDCSE